MKSTERLKLDHFLSCLMETDDPPFQGILLPKESLPCLLKPPCAHLILACTQPLQSLSLLCIRTLRTLSVTPPKVIIFNLVPPQIPTLSLSLSSKQTS